MGVAEMKASLFQYVSLTVAMLLLVVVVSLLPEQGAMNGTLVQQTSTGSAAINAVPLKDN